MIISLLGGITYHFGKLTFRAHTLQQLILA